MSTVAPSWFNADADNQPDLYIKIKNCESQVVYTSNRVNNTNAPVTFTIGKYLKNPPYTVEVWDYDNGSDDDLGGTYVINPTATGMFNYGNTNCAGTFNLSQTTNSPALDVHWGMEKTYDFFKQRLNRNSFDGNGGTIKNFINPPTALAADFGFPNNAIALPDPYNVMVYGMGDSVTFGPLVSVDIAGHEFSHMVINKNGNGGLTYAKESGALNESFADIMGIAIEQYAKGTTDWKVGEGLYLVSPFFIRSMSNPNAGYEPQPDTYGGQHWMSMIGCVPDETNDQCGVHVNSGVQNYWFYLLSQGGSGTNDIGTQFNVTGIGINDAVRIAYRNLTTYLLPNATHIDARAGSIQAAKDLFGAISSKVQAVRDAWCAVGIDCNSTNIQSLADAQQISIYPNPNNGQFTLKNAEENQTFSVLVTDVLGRKIYQVAAVSQQVQIDLGTQSKGMYNVIVFTEKGSVSKRVVIE